MLDIITYPNEILRQKSVEVKDFTEELKLLIKEMTHLLFDNSAVGIAAPQVAKSIRLFITVGRIENNQLVFTARIGEQQLTTSDYVVFVNPEISYLTDKKIKIPEACLSVPGVSVEIERCAHIMIKYKDENGKSSVIYARGLPAIVAQHEFDHVESKLIIDYIK